MNADERTPGQQGHEQQTSQQSQDFETTGEQGSPEPTPDDANADDTLTTGQASYGNSGETDTLSENSGSRGQDAMSEDLLGSDQDSGTTDIEVERSQGRESDVEGGSF